MSLLTLHTHNGARLAPDGIPLDYGNQQREYHAALSHAVLLDRSHEGRLELYGAHRFSFLNRMSTNNMMDLSDGACRATVFTNANGRIVDRMVAVSCEDHLLVLCEPGRNIPLREFLLRQVFFNDDVQIIDITPETRQFALHGPAANAVVEALQPGLADTPVATAHQVSIAGAAVRIIRRQPLVDAHWAFVTLADQARSVYEAILTAGKASGVQPAGSLTYNALRIRAGRPAAPELYGDFIPLEVGLWDDISFNKGCYTGQEIIARMESREQLARIMVSLALDAFVTAPNTVYHEGRSIGKLTSSVQSPDGQLHAIAVIRTNVAAIDTNVTVGDNHVAARVTGYLGTPPPFIKQP